MTDRTPRAEAEHHLGRVDTYDFTSAGDRALAGMGWALLDIADAIRSAAPGGPGAPSSPGLALGDAAPAPEAVTGESPGGCPDA